MSGVVTAERVPVLMYHRIGTPGTAAVDHYCVTPERFAGHLAWLASAGYRPCSIEAFAAWYGSGVPLPERSVLITFDDGFADLHAHALPLLAGRGWPATVFLVSALTGLRDRWIERGATGEGRHALLDRAQIDEMARHGIAFHSHSRTHADLTALDDAALTDQVQGSRDELQQLLGRRVDFFAYPYGRHDARVRQAVQAAGYRLAFSVEPGFNRAQGDALAVRRLDIVRPDSVPRFGRKVAMGSNDGSLRQQLRYLARRLAARLQPGR